MIPYSINFFNIMFYRYIVLKMCIVGKSELIKLINQYKCISPFNYKLLDGDGYVLTVKEETMLNYLEHKNLISHEIVFTPPEYVAHLTAKSKYGRMGLSFLNAAKVHSGFVGRLALELVNLSNDRQPITIKENDPLMHIEFMTRMGDPNVYDGFYMFQYMNDKEIELYIKLLSNEFNSIYTNLKNLAENRLKE